MRVSNNNNAYPERLEKLTRALMRLSDTVYDDSTRKIANNALLDSAQFIKRGGYRVAVNKMKLAVKQVLERLKSSTKELDRLNHIPARDVTPSQLDRMSDSHDHKAKVIAVNALRADALMEVRSKRRSKKRAR